MRPHLERWTVILLGACMIGTGCTNESRLEQEAQQVCQCLQPVDSLNRILASRLEAGQQEAVVEVLLDLGETSEKALDCILEHHPSGPNDWSEAFRDRLDQTCPGWQAIWQAVSGAEDQ